MDELRLERVSEFRYLRCVSDESGIDVAECCRKVVSERKVAGDIRSLVNARDLQLKCKRVLLHEALFVLIPLYGRRC